MHVHVHGHAGETKFWLEPRVELAQGHGLSAKELRLVKTLIEERYDDICDSWNRHFGR